MQIKVAKPFLKKITYPIFYIAYGSNLNKYQMQKRCPCAEPITKSYIEGYGLLFRSVATIIKEKESIMPCGIWRISEDCEKALDKYEGYPDMYGKEYWDGDRKFGYGGYKYIEGRWEKVAREMTNHYALPKNPKILDVGCGEGNLIKQLENNKQDIKKTYKFN